MPRPFQLFTLVPGLAGIMELVGGVLIVLGLFTRPVAFLLSGEMAFAYFMSHAPRGFFPISMGGNGGELAILYCFVFLYFFFVGAGVWSLDADALAFRTRRRAAKPPLTPLTDAAGRLPRDPAELTRRPPGWIVPRKSGEAFRPRYDGERRDELSAASRRPARRASVRRRGRDRHRGDGPQPASRPAVPRAAVARRRRRASRAVRPRLLRGAEPEAAARRSRRS